MTTTCTRNEWTAPDGEIFSYSTWEGDESPRAVVIAVHGLSGAALDFEPLGDHLAHHGVTTYAPELRGQGNDPVAARRGDLARIEDWYADLSAFFAMVRARHPAAITYYYGESMGAALLTRFVAQAGGADLPAGLILASPVVIVPNNPSLWRRFVFHIFVFLTPKRRIDVAQYTKRDDEENPAKWVTRSAEHRQWFKTAPHRITSFTFRFFKNLFELIGGCLEAAPQVRVPVLVIYAANDVFIPPAQVEQFFTRLGSTEKEIEFFPDSYHLLLHDFDKPQVLKRIEAWLLRRIAANESILRR
jgi:acylglycerol lipase